MGRPEESDDEELVLSSDALDALNLFYKERDERDAQFAKLQAEAQAEADRLPLLSMTAFHEDWNESQFWYSDETATFFANQLLEGATADTNIAVVSTPSVFVALKNILNTMPVDEPKPKLVLLEHDTRFAIFPEFVFYDFAQPLKLPTNLHGAFDRVILDPPFLSEDCQTKAAMTLRWLSKNSALVGPAAATANTELEIPEPRVLVVTGERMAPLIVRLYKSFGIRITDYDVQHANGLSNAFQAYANFETGAWKWRALEEYEDGFVVV